MSSFVRGNTIHISKDLADKISKKERKVVLAHEISHWMHKDNIKIRIIRVLFFMFPRVVNYFNRKMEIRADKEAIQTTKDPDSFINLLNKLDREGPGYPSRKFSIELANNMRGRI